MLIAIAAEDKNMDARVSQRAARAPYFLIFENGALIETLKNVFAAGGGGAGWSVAHILADKGVEVFMAGQIGENMRLALEQKGIEFKQVPSISALEAVKTYT